MPSAFLLASRITPVLPPCDDYLAFHSFVCHPVQTMIPRKQVLAIAFCLVRLALSFGRSIPFLGARVPIPTEPRYRGGKHIPQEGRWGRW